MATLELTMPQPLEAGPMLHHLEAHAVPGSEVHDSTRSEHSRLIRVPSGPRAVTVTIDAERVVLRTDTVDESEIEFIEAAVREWLDLDADLESIRDGLSEDPVIGPLIAERPGLRVVGYPDGFEGAIMTLLGQQVSLAAARTFGEGSSPSTARPAREV